MYKKQTYGIKVNHLSKSVSESELESAFGKYGTLAGHIHLRFGNTENHAFINYFSPTDAQAAADDMNGKCFASVQISVKVQGEWASSCSSPSSKKYTVKVTNLSKHTTNDTLEGIFGFSSEVTAKVNQTDGVFNYAYVNYDNPSDAEQAVKQLNGSRIGGNIVKVRLHSSGEDTVSSPSSSYESFSTPFSPARPWSIPPRARCQSSSGFYSSPTSPSLSSVKPSSVPTSPFQLQFQKKCLHLSKAGSFPSIYSH